MLTLGLPGIVQAGGLPSTRPDSGEGARVVVEFTEARRNREVAEALNRPVTLTIENAAVTAAQAGTAEEAAERARKREAGAKARKAAIDSIKRFHQFDTWAGKVKIPGKKVLSLRFTTEEFESLLKGPVAVRGRKPETALFLDVRKTDERSGGHLWVCVREDPRASHEAHMQGFRYHSDLGRTWRRARPDGGPVDIGDVCFYWPRREPATVSGPPNGGPFHPRLFFSRNNVSVGIVNSAKDPKRSMDVEALARFIDQKLVSWLVPVETGGGEPFPKPDEPAADPVPDP